MEVKIGQLRSILATYIQKQKPLMIHGAPGIGKSDSVRAATKEVAKGLGFDFEEGAIDEKKYGLIDVRISQLDPSDLRGIPFPEGDTTKWLIPSWLPRKGQGVLFFDEINLAPPSIQAACYQLILDRRIGDYVLPNGWTIVAAGNRAIDKANIFPMAAPLKNRFSHLELLVPSEEEWREWAIDNGVKNDIVSFMAFKPSFLYKFDAKSKDNAFPTPRSWANASHMTDHLDGKNQKELDEEFILAASCVGEGVALEYQAFVKLKKKVNLNDLLKNPKKVREINDVGLKYSMISGLAEKYKSDRKLMNDILSVVDNMDAEFGVFLLRLMKGQTKTFKEDLIKSPNWKPLFSKFSKYIF